MTEGITFQNEGSSMGVGGHKRIERKRKVMPGLLFFNYKKIFLSHAKVS